MNSFIIGLQRLDGIKRTIMGTIVNETELQLCFPIQRTYGLHNCLIKKIYSLLFVITWNDK